MTIEKRLERLEAILDARGLDWDHPRVTDEPPKEPPKKWRILDPGEVVCSSDWICARSNPPSDPPNGLGWRPVAASVGTSVFGEVDDYCVFARPVVDEPAKEAEPDHPAGPMPDPGEGYRLLSKNPPEDLQPGDEYQLAAGHWDESGRARTNRHQNEILWYRRKIEPPKPAWEPKVGDWVRVTRPKTPEVSDDTLWLADMDRFDGAVMQVEQFGESYQSAVVILAGYAFKVDWLAPAEAPEPEYREPVLPGDLGKWAELSQDGSVWHRWRLCGCYRRAGDKEISWNAVNAGNISFRHARIKKDA